MNSRIKDFTIWPMNYVNGRLIKYPVLNSLLLFGGPFQGGYVYFYMNTSKLLFLALSCTGQCLSHSVLLVFAL